MIVLPCPGESACAAPQKSAAASEARTTSRLRCDWPTSEAKLASAIRSGACRLAPLESGGAARAGGRQARAGGGGGRGAGAAARGEQGGRRRHIEGALEHVLRVGAQL